jgi:hypothetical protein
LALLTASVGFLTLTCNTALVQMRLKAHRRTARDELTALSR